MYSGKVCQPNPCQNGGTCSPYGLDTYSCNCPFGFTGRNCETRREFRPIRTLFVLANFSQVIHAFQIRVEMVVVVDQMLLLILMSVNVQSTLLAPIAKQVSDLPVESIVDQAYLPYARMLLFSKS